MPILQENTYGKHRVRLVKVTRLESSHRLSEWSLNIVFVGDFESCFTAGDNSSILPTDTIKNTVYSRARVSSATSMEDFALELSGFFLSRNPQVSAVYIEICETPWSHIHVNGSPHPTAFEQSTAERATTSISQFRHADTIIRSGLKHLVILKTADSAFTGYIKDPLTTLPETTDRLLGTEVTATWTYGAHSLPFLALRARVRETLLTTFAAHNSLSVQQTLYAMGEAVLNLSTDIADIHLTLPNRHCLLVDLSRFGQDNPNEIFVPTDEPHGYIQARVTR